MYLTKNQHITLKKIRKNNHTLTYAELHSYRFFKSDYQVQVTVQTLKDMGYINYVVYKSDPRTLKAKSDNPDDIIKDRFEYVNYLEPSNRLFISEKGIAYLQEYRTNFINLWLPIGLTLFVSIIQLIVEILD